MATQWLVAAPLLPNALPHRHNIYAWLRAITDAEAAKIRAQNAKNSYRNRALRASEATQGKTVQADSEQTLTRLCKRSGLCTWRR